MAAKELSGVGTQLTHDCGISRSPRAAMRGSVRVGESGKEPNREGGGPGSEYDVGGKSRCGELRWEAGVERLRRFQAAGNCVSKDSVDAKSMRVVFPGPPLADLCGEWGVLTGKG